MKHILPLATLLLSILSGVIFAQSPYAVSRIDDCPSEGCASCDRRLNIKKNLTAGPTNQTPTPMSLEEIMQLAHPAAWSTGKDRSELETLGEGRLVQVTAYLIDAEVSANCKLAESRLVNNVTTQVSVNDLLVLVSDDNASRKGADREAQSVIAEITPRSRDAHSELQDDKQTTNWTAQKLKLLISQSKKKAVRVRITGLLLLDTEHIGSSMISYREGKFFPIKKHTDWEIHPVLDISVCLKAKGCASDAKWEKLEKLVIRGRSRNKKVLPRGPRFKTKKH